MTTPELPASLEFPDLVIRNRISVPALEVGIDYLPERLELRWMDEVLDFTRRFVERSGFQKKATIWNWCGISGNLTGYGQRLPGRSMWHVSFGLPSTFLSRLELHLQRRIGEENARITEHIMVDRGDGWMPICHVEQGKAWKRVDADEWEVIVPRPRAITIAGEGMLTDSSGDATEFVNVDPPDPPATVIGRASASSPQDQDEEDLACDVRAVFADAKYRTTDEAVRDLASYLGYGRLGAKIKTRMNNTLVSAVNRGILATSANGLTLSHRSIQDFDQGVLQAQFVASLRRQDWIDNTEAIRGFARWLGFARTGAVITKTVQSVINALVRNGKLEKRRKLIRQVG